jgi:hypothetical protein
MGIFSSIYGGIKGLFTDEHGVVSSKRFVGIMCATMLCITMYHNSFSTVDVAPSPVLVDAVALLAFSSLGLSSVDKFTSNRKKIKDSTKQEE